MIRACVVDPSAFTPPYDHALCAALARQGAQVTLATSRFAYGQAPPPEGYDRRYLFYRRTIGPAGSTRRRIGKLAQHVPDMLRLRALTRHFDVIHFQWLDVQWVDRRLLPEPPVVLTAHDLLLREPRPGQARAQRALYEHVQAVIVHSEFGRRQLVGGAGVTPEKVHVVPHGALTHLTERDDERPLPPELARVQAPVVLFFGLLRPYKGLEVLLQAWRGIEDAELWIVGRPRMPLQPLRRQAPAGVRFVPRFVSEEELPAYFRRADAIVLPYLLTERFDQSGVLAAALAFGTPAIVSDIGGFSEIAVAGAAELVAPGDSAALHDAIRRLLGDPAARARLASAASAAAAGPFSWERAAQATLEVYRQVLQRP